MRQAMHALPQPDFGFEAQPLSALLEPPPRAFGTVEVVVIPTTPASLGERVAATAEMFGDLLVLFLQDLRASLKTLPH